MDLPDHLILYDGYCHLCNGSVKFILKHDRQKLFTFASLQSATGIKLREQHGIEVSKTESILYLRKGKLLQKSNAALWIASELGFPYQLIMGFILIPSFFRDFVYDIIAKKRYQWFGKSDSCIVPEPGIKDRFIDL